jgi:uncharacterized protein
MRIAIYGATGMIGSRVVAEALGRGHTVVGINRSGGELPEGAVNVQGDAGDTELAARIAGDADLVISAIGPSRTGGDRREYLASLQTLAENLGSARILVVGGAGSLFVDGVRLVDTPGFPEIYLAEAQIAAEALDYFVGLGEQVDWTFVSPAPLIQPGERSGEYRLGLDSPAGEQISAEDFALALIDEAERPAHRHRRFTAAN